MMIYLLRSNTTESLAALATMLAGLLLYFFAGQRLGRST
jgi:MFS superfamily sulfate permease-like transporter